MKKYDVVGILVVFNKIPSIDQISGILSSGITSICLVNNNPNYSEDEFSWVNSCNNVLLINNNNIGGLAGAYNKALNYIDKELKSSTHIIFLDDDSNFTALKNYISSGFTQKFLLNNENLVMGPRYIESATGLLGRCVRLSRFWFKVSSPLEKSLVRVSFIINSFSIWPRTIISQIGRFDESLSIDHIDTDFCMKARLLNIPIYINNSIIFEHSIGERVPYKFLWFNLQSSGHSAERKALIVRNTRILIFRYGFSNIGFLGLCVTRLIYEFISVIFAEKNKLKKLLFMVKGLIYK